MQNLVIPYRRWFWEEIVFATLLAGRVFGLQNFPGLILEELTSDSPGAKAGLQIADRIITYDGKTLASPAELQEAQENTFRTKEVVLEVRRGEQTLRLHVPQGILAVQVRPELSFEVAKLYEEGKTALKAGGNKNETIAKWEAAAKIAQQQGSTIAAQWLYRRSGQVHEDQGQWKEACATYLRVLQLSRESTDRAAKSRALEDLGRCTRSQNDFRTAEKWFKQAQQIDAAARDELWVAEDLNNLGAVAYDRGDLVPALDYFTRALRIRELLIPNSLELATTLNGVGAVAQERGDLKSAQDYYSRALAINQQLAPTSLVVAFTLNNLGTVAFRHGDLALAQDYYSRSLTIRERLAPNSLDVAKSLNNVGIIAYDRGDLAAAQDYYMRAVAIKDRLAPNSLTLAIGIDNLGSVAKRRGDLGAAEDYYRRALEINERLAPNSLSVALSFDNLGDVAFDGGDLAAAQAYYSRALPIKERLAPDSLALANSLDNLGDVAYGRSDLATAYDYYTRALDINRRLAPNSLDVASSFINLGEVSLARRNLPETQDFFHRALQIRERLGPESIEVAQVLTKLGNVALLQRQFSDARSIFARAVKTLEAQRGRIPSTEARAFLVARYGSAYDGLVQACLSLHDFSAAFSTSERARSRSLLDLLAEARIDIRQGIEPSLLKRERRLQELLNAKAERQTRLLSEKHSGQEAAAAAKDVDALTTEYHELEAKIRTSSPHYAALTQPQPLTLQQIQQQVLDKDSLLLEYSLADEASSLFAVSQNSIKTYPLPKRAEIEALARQTYELLTARNQYNASETIQQRNVRILQADNDYRKLAARLSQMILAPATSELGTKRLLIVADGALLQIPFAALEDPAPVSPRPLVTGHQIVSLPSASVIAIQRREFSKRKSAAKQLAIFADPVFAPDDERVAVMAHLQEARAKVRIANGKLSRDTFPPQNEESEFERAIQQVAIRGDRSRIHRLPFSREEATSIFAFTGQTDSLMALDFDANKNTASAEEMSRYRIVHFATHALLNNDHPELSGVVLSLVDRQGQGINGFLRLNEIYNLNLPADLVVLSACQTALGKQIKGEGLIGLTRGFMYAGAARVVASLWKVDDEATAELMKRFYGALLKEGQPVPLALRQAQMEMRMQKRWSAPYYWAGFEMQGEWKSGSLSPVQNAN
jgi:CHAT domain-containing protein/Tfp pilus assembly protein PilF